LLHLILFESKVPRSWVISAHFALLFPVPPLTGDPNRCSAELNHEKEVKQQ
jgi:hypothetical protein